MSCFQRRFLVIIFRALFLFFLIVPCEPAVIVHADDITMMDIDGGNMYQTIDGFGFTEAFESAVLHGSEGLSPTNQKQILGLLMDPVTGAGFSIVRSLISSGASSIEPNDPGGPNAPPQYVWDGDDNSQIWFLHQAQLYGISRFYAEAWSAPGYMKNNGSGWNGGSLCGVPYAPCSSGDWRRAYANYLIQYIREYQSVGIPLTHIGFVNEPDWVASYPSMTMSPEQLVDFIKVLGPMLAQAHVPTQLVCCDATNWAATQAYANAIAADPQASFYLSLISGHGYFTPPDSAITGISGKHVWQSEWSTFENWDPYWDDNSLASGFAWSQRILTSLTLLNTNAFSYFWGATAKTDNEGLILLHNDSYQVSKRLWAFANFSRFIHPGAVRIGAHNPDGKFQLGAFENPDGSIVIVVLNTNDSDMAIGITMRNLGLPAGSVAVPYVTNDYLNTAVQTPLSITNGAFASMVPGRTLITFVINANQAGFHLKRRIRR